MNIFEKVSVNIADRVSRELNHDPEKREVIEYGAFVLIHTVAVTALSLFIAYLLGLLFPAAILFFTIGAIRNFSGGAHASTPNRCAVIGAAVNIILAYLTFGLSKVSNLWFYYIYLIMCIFTSLLIINKYCPVDSENKPIKR